MVEPPASRILVIKLGALGDFAQAIGPFAAIRRHHADAHVTLLTTAPYAPFAEAGGWFDEVWIDARPPAHRVGQIQIVALPGAGNDFLPHIQVRLHGGNVHFDADQAFTGNLPAGNNSPCRPNPPAAIVELPLLRS